MQSSLNSPNIIARATAHLNAAEASKLPDLPKGYEFQTLEIYLGDELDTPAVVIHRCEIIFLNVPTEPTNLIQLIGDGHPVYVAIDGETLRSRIKHCKLPDLGATWLSAQLEATIGR
jgi:hypothetical protein